MPDSEAKGPPAVPATAIEGLGAFYLGRRPDEAGAPPFMYDARDLTTHAVVLGMTGSGKTGLCITLLEEAGLDGIPALIELGYQFFSVGADVVGLGEYCRDQIAKFRKAVEQAGGAV